ncbi:fimbrial protein [Pantoea anthophila]|uniref:fimbrial protein n=1 Tax=Pantoea anthophila TaxID=470931 RepID=UPI002785B3A1|nr:fimbrial protein [Pantoea anthophila]MDQ1215037.1 major type 1 subunit fimbrin (pilin) [Pantoea anthophila]
MKKLAFLTASVVSALFVSQAFAASDNTITFQGEVTAETCSVTINGNSANPLVLLPSVSASDLLKSGDVKGATTFEIGVSGCTGKTDDVSTTTISTVFSGNSVSTAGNLTNVAATNGAKNVEIQILQPDGKTWIDFNKGTFKATGDLSLKGKATSASSIYTAQYFATDAASAGAVEATLQYAVSYN